MWWLGQAMVKEKKHIVILRRRCSYCSTLERMRKRSKPDTVANWNFFILFIDKCCLSDVSTKQLFQSLLFSLSISLTTHFSSLKFRIFRSATLYSTNFYKTLSLGSISLLHTSILHLRLSTMPVMFHYVEISFFSPSSVNCLSLYPPSRVKTKAEATHRNSVNVDFVFVYWMPLYSSGNIPTVFVDSRE